jgi:uncharacterized protein (DUF2147 family)
MKRIIAAGIICLIPAGAALAQQPPQLQPSPTGEWRVKDGTADIRVVNCGGAMWGVIAWTKGGPANTDTDKNNPDPALRNRPVLGLPILLNMQPSEGKWEGEVYNAENGKTYSSNISLVSPDVLAIEGCVLGFLCGGENWTRVPLPKGSPTDQAVCAKLSK